MRRRAFMGTALTTAGGVMLGGCEDLGLPADNKNTGEDAQKWVMPDEGNTHERTWMAFGASESIWGADLLPEVRRSLATTAQAIARFEPVSMLVRPGELDLAKSLIGSANVELVAFDIDDLWIRDTGPVFVKDGQAKAGVDFNFNGWGGKQEHSNDAKVAEFVTSRSGVQTLHTDLVLEGGALEVDGEGTAIITESCVLNSNRNPGWKKPDVEKELGRLLGIQKVIWLPGIAGRDITDGHTDFYARFAGPGVVVAGLDNDPQSFDYDVTRRHLDILRAATDVHGRPLKVEVLEAPYDIRPQFSDSEDFAAGYINFYVCNGGVIAPEFGDSPADATAKATLQRLFPNRQVVQINIDGIAAGGGGIHCATQQAPA